MIFKIAEKEWMMIDIDNYDNCVCEQEVDLLNIFWINLFVFMLFIKVWCNVLQLFFTYLEFGQMTPLTLVHY